MPELPEVETVRRGLERLVVGKTITAVEISYPRLVVTGADQLAADLVGATITGMARRGKYLIFELGDRAMISHLRMEGKWLLFPQAEVPANKHFHAFFDLSDGSTLVYQDVRKFGTLELLGIAELRSYFTKKKLGPEPVKGEFGYAPFERAVRASRKPIKPHLLDQSLVVGLGNIYVDEVLWASRVHPESLSSQLKPAQIKRLHAETMRILQLGIEKGGSTVRTYRNALGEDGTMQTYHQVYAKTGQPCGRCAAPIEKIKVAGRGSHFCPNCQKI